MLLKYDYFTHHLHTLRSTMRSPADAQQSKFVYIYLPV